MTSRQVSFRWNLMCCILGPVRFNLYATFSSNGKSTNLVYADVTTLLRHTKVSNLQQTIGEMQLEVGEHMVSREKSMFERLKDKGFFLISQRSHLTPFAGLDVITSYTFLPLCNS